MSAKKLLPYAYDDERYQPPPSSLYVQAQGAEDDVAVLFDQSSKKAKHN